MGADPLRVLVVDDNPLFLATAASYVARAKGATLVGRAESGAEGVRLASSESPHLVLVDLTMPDMDGIECARRIKAATRAPRVVIVTAHEYESHAARAKAAGVDGFVSKWNFVSGIAPWLASRDSGR
jgi:DNA-binding NarL/FixJ family response regulator